MSFTDVIAQGCFTWNIPLPEGALEGLEEYTRLLLEKNQVMNLTAITEPDQVAVRHMLDCLFQLSCGDFEGKRVIDIGSGGRVPWYSFADRPAQRPVPAAGQPEKAGGFFAGSVRCHGASG